MNHTYTEEKTEYYVYIIVGLGPILCLCLIGLIMRACHSSSQVGVI